MCKIWKLLLTCLHIVFEGVFEVAYGAVRGGFVPQNIIFINLTVLYVRIQRNQRQADQLDKTKGQLLFFTISYRFCVAAILK